jgi:hypothetical protein
MNLLVIFVVIMTISGNNQNIIKKIFYKNDDAIHSWAIWIIYAMMWLYIGQYENTTSLGIITCSIIFSSAVIYEKSINSKTKDDSGPFRKMFKTEDNKSMSFGVYLFIINYIFLFLLILHNISDNDFDAIIDTISLLGVFFVFIIVLTLFIIPLLFLEDWANDWSFGTSLKLSFSPSHNADMVKHLFEVEE